MRVMYRLKVIKSRSNLGRKIPSLFQLVNISLKIFQLLYFVNNLWEKRPPLPNFLLAYSNYIIFLESSVMYPPTIRDILISIAVCQNLHLHFLIKPMIFCFSSTRQIIHKKSKKSCLIFLLYELTHHFSLKVGHVCLQKIKRYRMMIFST